MNERLIKLMDVLEYTPSVFADEVGVIRSSISHIMSGRNKPGVELLQKVLKRFPEVSAEWLLAGLGPMFRDGQRPNVNSSPKREPVKEQMETARTLPENNGQINLLGYLESIQQPAAPNSAPDTQAQQPAQPRIVEQPQVQASVQPGARPAQTDQPESYTPDNQAADLRHIVKSESGQPMVQHQPELPAQSQPDSTATVQMTLPAQKEKNISRIVIYFNDKTYQEFRATED